MIHNIKTILSHDALDLLNGAIGDEDFLVNTATLRKEILKECEMRSRRTPR